MFSTKNRKDFAKKISLRMNIRNSRNYFLKLLPQNFPSNKNEVDFHSRY